MNLVKAIKTDINIVGEKYSKMLQNVADLLPVADKTSEVFHKSHSQFMQVTLDITQLTPIRSIKHTLAEINNTKRALSDAFFRAKKKEIEVRQKKAQILASDDHLEIEMLEVEISEIEAQAELGRPSLEAAVRKLNFMLNQYEGLKKSIGVDDISEEDYEREECKYHIMTAMKQALTAARTRGGLIDEGNQIYLFELGINGADAQFEIFKFLEREKKVFETGDRPSHRMIMEFLEQCAERWADAPSAFARSRGFETLDYGSLLTHEVSEDVA